MDSNKSGVNHYVLSTPRVIQQRMAPTAVKPNQLAQTTLFNTEANILGPFSLANNASLSIQSVIANSNNPNIRIAGVPYCITFFQTSLSVTNIIGSAITGSYTMNGPMPMAQFTPHATASVIGGNNGNNLVFLTELINKSGGTQIIYAITNTRVYTTTGGSAS